MAVIQAMAAIARGGIAALAIAAMTGCAAAPAPAGREHIVGPRPPGAAALPFSDGVLAGDTLYLSGKLGLDPNGKVPATVAEEVRLVMEAVKETLARANMTMDDLVYVQVFCSDLSLYAPFNEIYRTYFAKYPARAFIGSGALLFGAHFEVQGIAVRR